MSSMESLLMSRDGDCCPANVQRSLYVVVDWLVRKPCAIFSAGMELAPMKV